MKIQQDSQNEKNTSLILREADVETIWTINILPVEDSVFDRPLFGELGFKSDGTTWLKPKWIAIILKQHKSETFHKHVRDFVTDWIFSYFILFDRL